MAKKSKKQKKSRGRRRIGAALNPSSPIVKGAAIAAGYFLGNTINPLIDKITAGKVSDKIVGVGQTGLGALLLLSKGRSSIIKTAVGGVVAGSGLKRALVAYGVVKPPVNVAIPPPGTTSTVTGYLPSGVNRVGRVGSNVGRAVAGAQGSQLLN